MSDLRAAVLRAVLAIIDAHQCYDKAALAEVLVILGGYAGHPMSDVWRNGSASEVAAAIIAGLHKRVKT